MVFNAFFNNISVISHRSVLLVGNRSTRRKPPLCRKPRVHLAMNGVRTHHEPSQSSNEMGEYQYEIQIFKSKRIHNPL
jgi:hypothetical protein